MSWSRSSDQDEYEGTSLTFRLTDEYNLAHSNSGFAWRTTVADRWSRWMPVSGIVFGILFVVGLLMNNAPDGTDAQVNAFYAKSSNRIVTVIAAYVLVVAALAFLRLFCRSPPAAALHCRRAGQRGVMSRS